MLNSNKALQVTARLLNSGVFNHLEDHDLSILKTLMLRFQRGQMQVAKRIISYWYKADYYNADLPEVLLQDVNSNLQSIGYPLI
ncbi:MAG: hypothetical protein JWN76_1307 [Chitinophagaceae bacterium]|nr:hypothetical protein [Chitinophagaceae bacterium]